MTNAQQSPDPLQLLAQASAGQRDALGQLLDLYRNYLYLFARMQTDIHLCGRANPSDFVQETFVHACRRFEQFQGQSEPEFLAWLRSILVRALATAVRRQVVAQKRDARREVSLDARLKRLDRSSEAFDAALVSPISSPSVQAARREQAAEMADRLAGLPAAQREVIVLRNLEGLPFEEVARRMNKTPGAVRVLWLRALAALRKAGDSEGG